MVGKIKKKIGVLLLMLYILAVEVFILILENISCLPLKIQKIGWKTNYSLNDSKQCRMAWCSVTKLLLRGVMSKLNGAWIAFIHLEQKKDLNQKTKYRNRDFWSVGMSSE